MKNTETITKLKEVAKAASLNSYSPYSQFKVGAAVLDIKGNIYSGCNVENLAFPSGVCAEITAIVKGMSEHGPGLLIDTIVVYTPTKTPTSPCGWCRQVIHEHGSPETRVVSLCDSDEALDTTIHDLFPESPNIQIRN